MIVDELLLLSGNDIPFPAAQLVIHQPKIKQIALITESNFWHGCGLLNFEKDNLENQVKNVLSNQSNFNIIMSMIQEKSIESQQAKINVLSILTLIFPMYRFKLEKSKIQLYNEDTKEIKEINEDNFEILKSVLVEMFCLKANQKQYNPSGELAKSIARKIKQGKEKRAKLAPAKKVSMLSRYCSILAVGEHKDLNLLMNYTIYQIMDEFNRFQLKMISDNYDRWKRAGATGLNQPPENWQKDIYEITDNK